MPKRTGEAEWTGDLKGGKGTVGTGESKRNYSFSSRFENGTGTNPEELVGQAHAACFSMALSHALTQAGFPPKRVHTRADVTIEKVGDGFEITRIDLNTEGDVPGIDAPQFQTLAEKTKQTCPVSKALAAVKTVTLSSSLLSPSSR